MDMKVFFENKNRNSKRVWQILAKNVDKIFHENVRHKVEAEHDESLFESQEELISFIVAKGINAHQKVYNAFPNRTLRVFINKKTNLLDLALIAKTKKLSEFLIERKARVSENFFIWLV